MICLPCSGNLARTLAMQKRWTLPASELPALGFDAARIAASRARLQEILARAQQFWRKTAPNTGWLAPSCSWSGRGSMSVSDLLIGLGCGLAGFGVVWWLFSVVRQQKTPPMPMGPVAARIEPRRISVAELGSTWHVILGVPAESTAVEIEAAYHARLAECDRIRFSPDETALSKQSAEAARARVSEAYEFIRQVQALKAFGILRCWNRGPPAENSSPRDRGLQRSSTVRARTA